MNSFIRSETVMKITWQFVRHVANVAPAASFWSSGIGVLRSQARDETAWIAFMLVLFVSAGVSALAYQPAFRSANFGLVSLILAVICAARELRKASANVSLLERVESCLGEYGTMLWCIAVALVLAQRRTPRREIERSLPQVEQPQGSSKNQSLLDWVSERGDHDPDHPPDSLSTAGSFYFKHMVGPRSQVSEYSNNSGTSISLSSNASCPDANRTARIKRVLDSLSK